MRYDANGKLKPQQPKQRPGSRPASRYSGTYSGSRSCDSDSIGGTFGMIADAFGGGGGSDCTTSSSDSSSCSFGD